jgi:hypothetical protein
MTTAANAAAINRGRRDIETRLFEALRSRGIPLSTNEIAQRARTTYRQAAAGLDQLEADGTIEKTWDRFRETETYKLPSWPA